MRFLKKCNILLVYTFRYVDFQENFDFYWDYGQAIYYFVQNHERLTINTYFAMNKRDF